MEEDIVSYVTLWRPARERERSTM